MADFADVAVVAIEADLSAARLLAQDLRAAGVQAEAVMPSEAEDLFGAAAALVFYVSAAALEAPEWRRLAEIASGNAETAVIAAYASGVDPSATSDVFAGSAAVAPAKADRVIDLLAGAIGAAQPGGSLDAPVSPVAAGDVLSGGLDSLDDDHDDEALQDDSFSDGDIDELLEEIEAEELESEEPELERSAPSEAPASAPPKAERRIDVPDEGAASAPPAPPVAAAPASRAREALKRRAPANEQAASSPIKNAKLFENAPRKMRLGVRREITARISGDQDAGKGMSGQVKAHAIAAAQVMTVTLDDPDFAFAIRPLTPATQWIDRTAIARLGFLGAAEAAEWRWSVEPIKTGAHRLSISASARIADASGNSADASLPPQVVEVSVSVAPSLMLARAARWAAVAIGAAVLGHYGVEIINGIAALLA